MSRNQRDWRSSDDRSIRPKKPQRHARLKKLDCYEEMHQRIVAGHPLPEVARWLQEEKLSCTDITSDSLVTTLARYRKDIAPAEIAEELIPKVAFEAQRRVTKGIDELTELEDLYQKQMDRIGLGMKFENATQILNRFVNQEISLAVDILRRRHDIKMDIGIGGGRNLGTMTVRPELMIDVHAKYGDDVYDAITDPEARNKVLSIARSLAEFDNVIDATAIPSGGDE